jgi:hypothetical protein
MRAAKRVLLPVLADVVRGGGEREAWHDTTLRGRGAENDGVTQ